MANQSNNIIANSVRNSASNAVSRPMNQVANAILPTECLPIPDAISLHGQGLLSGGALTAILLSHGASVDNPNGNVLRYDSQQFVLDGSKDDTIASYNQWDLAVSAQEYFPSVAEIADLTIRGAITPALSRRWTRRHGIKSRLVHNCIVHSRMIIPPPQDLVRMQIREVFNDQLRLDLGLDSELNESPDYLFWARRSGLGKVNVLDDTGGVKTRDFAADYWAAHWIQPSVSQAYEFYHRVRPDNIDRVRNYIPGVNPFTLQDLEKLLKVNDIAPTFRKLFAAISFNLPRIVDLRRMYAIGVISKDDLVSQYRDRGYNPLDAKAVADFVEIDAPWKPPVVQLSKWLNSGLIDEDEAKSELKRRLLTDQSIDRFLAFNVYKPTVSTAVRWLRAGYINISRFSSILRSHGVGKDDIENYRKESISKLANQNSQLSVSKIREAYEIGYIDEASARQKLLNTGMQATDIDQVIKTIDLQIDIDYLKKAIAGIRKEFLSGEQDSLKSANRLSSLGLQNNRIQRYINLWRIELFTSRKQVSAQQAIDALKRGLITVDDLRNRLSNLGYSRSDADLFVLFGYQDVQLAAARAAMKAAQTATQQQAAAKRVAAETKRASKEAIAELARHGSPAQLKAWIARGIITSDVAMQRLIALQWPALDSQRLIEEGLQQYAERQARLAKSKNETAPQA